MEFNERKCSVGEIDCGLVALGEGNARQVKRIQGVKASLLGVGAPEALVIGVVALLVFGPKGLAEVFISFLSSFSASLAQFFVPILGPHALVSTYHCLLYDSIIQLTCVCMENMRFWAWSV